MILRWSSWLSILMNCGCLDFRFSWFFATSPYITMYSCELRRYSPFIVVRSLIHLMKFFWALLSKLHKAISLRYLCNCILYAFCTPKAAVLHIAGWPRGARGGMLFLCRLIIWGPPPGTVGSERKHTQMRYTVSINHLCALEKSAKRRAATHHIS